MFVSQSKYDRVLRERNAASMNVLSWQLEHKQLLTKWNQLVERINKLGGENFLQATQGAQFTDDELRSLLQLVHPDKHGGKDSAHRLTQKINKLRG